MGPTTRPRRRLPRRVYWVRRGVVLVLALLLVLGIGKLVGVGSDQAGSALEAGLTTVVESESPEPSATLGPFAPPKKLRRPKAAVPLLPPRGDCRDDEISVLPAVARAWAGHEVVIRLRLQGTQPACSFEISPSSLVVKVTAGRSRIWSSQECKGSIPRREVVVRSSQPVVVPVVWSGRRSDAECTPGNAWALTGFYHAYAAVLGSAPSEVQFEVTLPDVRIVTETPRPKPKSSPGPGSSTPEPRATTGKRP